MARTIDSAYVETFERTVRHQAQQGITRLRPWVDVRSVQSEAHNWEIMSSNEAVQKRAAGSPSVSTPTPDNETGWLRRVSVPVTYHIGDVSEQEDIVQMIVDPNNNYARSHGMAMRRAHDKEIIAKALGTALDGGGNNNALPASQVVGDYSQSINYDIVTEVTEKFMNNDIDPDEPKCFVVSPKQARKLLQLTEATSGDYNAMRPLTSQGYVESWMGYSWIVSTLLNYPTEIDADVDCFAMTSRAVGMQINKDIWSRIEEDPSASFAWRIYSASTYGAVRVEDEQIVKVQLSQAI